MFDTVVGAKRAMRELLDSFEPGSVLASDAQRLVVELAELERLVAAAKTLCAARVAETRLWARDGARSPAHWLAKASGTTIGDARGLLDAADQLTELPRVTEAFRAGDLSGPQVKAVADAATADPSAEATLVEAAGRDSFAELRHRCAKTKAAAIDDTTRHQHIHDTRSVTHWTDPDGAACGRWRLTPDTGALLLAALTPLQQAAFDQARRDGRREPPDAYTADALVALARQALDCPTSHDGTDANNTLAERTSRNGRVNQRRSDGSRAKIIVRIDHTALTRGHTHPGETCEIAGIGPVPVTVVRDWMHDAFLAAIVTNGTDIASVVHLGRTPTALQRTALQWRDPDCAVLGCPTQTGLQIDHTPDWAHTHHTTLNELQHLCPHHHDLKTRATTTTDTAGTSGPDPP